MIRLNTPLPSYVAGFAHLRGYLSQMSKNVTSRVFTWKTAPPPGGHFHDDWAKRKMRHPTGSHIILTKFYENWAKNVTSRVFTCFHYIHKEKTAPPTGGHVFSLI
ncbi:hypothetical protein DPMN_121577 [Dreissena polymorpha]|uniref:Uncharacterized protein n=1 Tax=Dreissena polymorpha TaxID=45954 RepID=A0A9D4GMQ8_DREPO|nr:hypothetical protein DPMN_121577 [Dreissena polymorpha]